MADVTTTSTNSPGFFQQLGNAFSSTNLLNTILTGAAGVGSFFTGQDQKESLEEISKRFDPFGPERPQYMANLRTALGPSGIDPRTLPGFSGYNAAMDFAADKAMRTLAQKGSFYGGGTGPILGNIYAQHGIDAYKNYLDTLLTTSGAKIDPSEGMLAAMLAANQISPTGSIFDALGQIFGTGGAGAPAGGAGGAAGAAGGAAGAIGGLIDQLTGGSGVLGALGGAALPAGATVTPAGGIVGSVGGTAGGAAGAAGLPGPGGASVAGGGGGLPTVPGGGLSQLLGGGAGAIGTVSGATSAASGIAGGLSASGVPAGLSVPGVAGAVPTAGAGAAGGGVGGVPGVGGLGSLFGGAGAVGTGLIGLAGLIASGLIPGIGGIPKALGGHEERAEEQLSGFKYPVNTSTPIGGSVAGTGGAHGLVISSSVNVKPSIGTDALRSTAMATDQKLSAAGFPTLASLPDGYALTALPVGALKIIIDSNLVSAELIISHLNMSTDPAVRAKATELLTPAIQALQQVHAKQAAKLASAPLRSGSGK